MVSRSGAPALSSSVFGDDCVRPRLCGALRRSDMLDLAKSWWAVLFVQKKPRRALGPPPTASRRRAPRPLPLQGPPSHPPRHRRPAAPPRGRITDVVPSSRPPLPRQKRPHPPRSPCVVHGPLDHDRRAPDRGEIRDDFRRRWCVGGGAQSGQSRWRAAFWPRREGQHGTTTGEEKREGGPRTWP